MKKGTIIPLAIVVVVALVSTIFFITNRDKGFDLKNISWTLTMDELEKQIGDEFTPISNSYIHTYKGIKKVTDLEASVRYVFDSSSKLESIDVMIKTYEESAVEKILAMSEVIKSKESDEYKKYTLKIGDSLVELVGNVSQNAIVLSIEEYTGQIENNSFVINEIDWTATRDEVKEKTEIDVYYDKEDEELSPLGYNYDSIEGLTEQETPVIYYFNEDGSMRSVYIPIDYDTESLDTILNYFGITPDGNKKEWTVSKDNMSVLVSQDDDYVSVSLFNSAMDGQDASSFSIENINWSATRADIKEQTGFAHSNENDKAIGYIYNGVNGITDEKTEVIYYFDESDNIIMTFFMVDYNDDNLKKVLEYFNLSVADGVKGESETNWKTDTENASVIIGHKNNDKVLSVAIGKRK